MARVRRADRWGEVVSRGASARRLGIFACTTGLLVASGCTDIFGYQGAESVVQCLSDSDCRQVDPLDVCSAAGYCILSDQLDATVDTSHAGEASVDAGPDSGCGDIASSALNCGLCGHACQSTVCDNFDVCAPNVCENSTCGGLSVQGSLWETGPNGDNLAVSGQSIAAFQVNVSAGWLTAFGVITSDYFVMSPDGGKQMAPPAHGYVGLYTDFGGIPYKLVAVAEGAKSLTLTQNTNQLFTVTPPVQLSAALYWIAVLFDEDVLFSAAPGQVAVAVDYPYQGEPLPANSPPETIIQCDLVNMPCNYKPALYLVLAQP
jgi:hypothetical protein